jgi:hypothetical protein
LVTTTSITSLILTSQATPLHPVGLDGVPKPAETKSSASSSTEGLLLSETVSTHFPIHIISYTPGRESLNCNKRRYFTGQYVYTEPDANRETNGGSDY